MIYLDSHATTPVLPEVWEAMRPFAVDVFGNPSSSHAFGRRARQALEDARERIAARLDAFPDEVIFTSGATEANNLAIFGMIGEPPGTIVASPIEHPCVIEPILQLANRGFQAIWLPVHANGAAIVDSTGQQVTLDTRFIALMLVNHETGAFQPVGELVRRFPDIRLHCDAAQAVGKLPVRFHQLGVTSLSLSGHKFGAPKGIGALILRRGIKLQPSLFGGHQQQGRRPGTEPVALAVGLATALELATDRLHASLLRVREIRDRFLAKLQTSATPLVVNSPAEGSPYVVNVSFPGCRADLLLMKLDLAGVACSTGSACSSGSLLPSPVLKAMQVPAEVLQSAMRFSFSSQLSDADISAAADCVIESVRDLRRTDT